MNVYAELTREFNRDRLRAILSSGQAVVLHRLAVMSKDGDWILREDEEALRHVLGVLASHAAMYRLGAPLDTRWLAGGWSAHFEFQHASLRVRTDFVSRPPRIPTDRLVAMWREQESRTMPFVDVRDLVELKKTNREKDYAVIGELARMLPDPADQLLLSRSARDLTDLARQHARLVEALAETRPLLREISRGTEVLEAALDAERRVMMHVNERRLQAYMRAAEDWAAIWPEVARQVAGLSLLQAHPIVVSRAEGVLPFCVEAVEP